MTGHERQRLAQGFLKASVIFLSSAEFHELYERARLAFADDPINAGRTNSEIEAFGRGA